MNEALSSVAVRSVIEGGKGMDRQAKIAKLEKTLSKVKKDIAEEERIEKRCALVQSAYAKLKRELGKSLTPEEYQAIEGIYLFLHGGCVDMIRHIPSSTDRGEGKRLEKDLDLGKALKELDSLTK